MPTLESEKKGGILLAPHGIRLVPIPRGRTGSPAFNCMIYCWIITLISQLLASNYLNQRRLCNVCIKCNTFIPILASTGYFALFMSGVNDWVSFCSRQHLSAIDTPRSQPHLRRRLSQSAGLKIFIYAF